MTGSRIDARKNNNYVLISPTNTDNKRPTNDLPKKNFKKLKSVVAKFTEVTATPVARDGCSLCAYTR